jgi:hypothetical protein
MNGVEHVAWGAADDGSSSWRVACRRVPLELVLLAVATVGELLGAVTHPLAGAMIAIVVAVALTARHVGAEVRALRAWEPAP